MKEESQNLRIDPELEARIVALVLGEASDFERDELNRQIEKRPELAEFKEQMQIVHGLLWDVGDGELVAHDLVAHDDDWKLSTEKRIAVLAMIRGEATDQPAKQFVNRPAEKQSLVKEGFFWNLTKIAAVFCVAGFVGLMAIPVVNQSTGSARSRQLAVNDKGIIADGDTLEGLSGKANGQLSKPFFKGGNEQPRGLIEQLNPERPSQPPADGYAVTVQDSPTSGDMSPRTEPSGLGYSSDPFSKLGDAEKSQTNGRSGSRERLTELGVERLELKGKSDSSLDAAGVILDSQESGRGPEASPGRPLLRGDAAFSFSTDKAESAAAERDIAQDDSNENADGEVDRLGRFGNNESVTTDVLNSDLFGEHKPEEGLQDFGSALETDEKKELPPIQRSVAETSRGVNEGQAKDASVHNFFDSDMPQYSLSVDNSESMNKSPLKRSFAAASLNENNAADDAFSTFSLHVSDVSFKLAQAALARGEWPDAAKVRIEEFVNAFDYGDPMPSQDEKVACYVEQSIQPFLQQRNLVRVSMRTAAAGRASNTPLRLTFLLDNSGSMERIDRQQTVRRAFAVLAQQLQPTDQVTLISFARQPRLLADKVNGAQSGQLVELIGKLPSEGGTNIEAALQLAFEKALEQQDTDAQNRIVLLTDGAVNLGDANPDSLSQMISSIRDAGIAFDAAGISAEGLNDEILEALTRKGDGRYYLLDSLEAADDGFARQIAGALRPSAKNVKVQVEFNPKRVGRYKLLGFEKHLLKQEDFRNDAVDAAEMAAAEAGVAVYQFEAKPEGEGDVGSVSVRFRDLSTGQMIENRWPIPYEADAPRPEQATPSLRIAISAALLAAKLRGEPLGETVDLKTLSDLISGLPDRERTAKPVQQLQQMIEQARQLSGN